MLTETGTTNLIATVTITHANCSSFDALLGLLKQFYEGDIDYAAFRRVFVVEHLSRMDFVNGRAVDEIESFCTAFDFAGLVDEPQLRCLLRGFDAGARAYRVREDAP